MKISTLFIILILFISCKQDESKHKKSEWSFIDAKFGDKNIRLLNGYDVFDFTKLSDSTIVLDGEIFQGWKSKSLSIKDTLKITENYFVVDSLGNRINQILSYSKQDQTYFQLIVTKNELTHSTFQKTDKEDSDLTVMEEKLRTEIWFNYKGKLFINKNNKQYFSDNLYTK